MLILLCVQVLKVAILAEKYAVDYTWYVDTILNLIRIAGDYVSEEVWYRVIQIVINRDDVQGYAAKTVFEVRIIGWIQKEIMLPGHFLKCGKNRSLLQWLFSPEFSGCWNPN